MPFSHITVQFWENFPSPYHLFIIVLAIFVSIVLLFYTSLSKSSFPCLSPLFGFSPLIPRLSFTSTTTSLLTLRNSTSKNITSNLIYLPPVLKLSSYVTHTPTNPQKCSPFCLSKMWQFNLKKGQFWQNFENRSWNPLNRIDFDITTRYFSDFEAYF